MRYRAQDDLRQFVSILSICLLLGANALAMERVALVVGNSQYQQVQDLDNPVSDSTKIAAMLRRLGFDVTLRSKQRHAVA